MPTAKTIFVYEEGEKVETIHGEKCVVIRQEGQKVLLKGTAEQPCWFPVTKIKDGVQDEEVK